MTAEVKLTISWRWTLKRVGKKRVEGLAFVGGGGDGLAATAAKLLGTGGVGGSGAGGAGGAGGGGARMAARCFLALLH